MAIGGKRRGARRGASGTPRRRSAGPADLAHAARWLRFRWALLGALASLAVGVFALLVAGGLRGAGDASAGRAARADVADPITAAVETALGPLGLRAGPDLLAAPAALSAALDAATDDAGVVRAAAAGEALLGLLAPARDAIAAVDVPAAVRGRGLEEGFVVDLISARQRMLDALDLYRAAARLAVEAALLEDPSLSEVLDTARDLASQAEATFLEGHDLLIDAQVSAGTYDGPLMPAGSGGLG